MTVENNGHDWHIDEGDPDVGIFGTSILHANCDTEDDAVQTDVTIVNRDEHTVTVTTTWECECGAKFIDVTQEQRADFELPLADPNL